MEKEIVKLNKSKVNVCVDCDSAYDLIRFLTTINKGDYRVDWNTYFEMIREIDKFMCDYNQKNMCIDPNETFLATIDHFKDSVEHQKILHDIFDEYYK